MRLKRVTSDGNAGASCDDAGFLAFERRNDDVVWPSTPRLLIAALALASAPGAGRRRPTVIAEVLGRNRVPATLAERLTCAARNTADSSDDPAHSSDDPIVGLTAALATCLSFVSMRALPRHGARTQLAEFAAITGAGLHSLDEVADLARSLRGGPGRIIVDTSGINPFDSHKMAHLAALVGAARAEPILVLPANSEPAALLDERWRTQ